jgi:hypothetical protein
MTTITRERNQEQPQTIGRVAGGVLDRKHLLPALPEALRSCS